MAKLLNYNRMFFIVAIFIVFGLQACAVPYDDTYVLDCLATPLNAQYGGGIVVNPELNDGISGWRMTGDARMDYVASEDGNKFIVAYNRKLPNHSFAQTLLLEAGKIYTLSAWLQVSHGKAHVAAVLETETGSETAGWVMARTGCWSMLKGGLTAKTSGRAHLRFVTNVTEVAIFGDSFSVQSFTLKEWQSHQQDRIQKVRKTRVILQAVDQAGRAVPNATVSLTQTRQGFPFGCAINQHILNNTEYRRWFLDRFNYTVFEEELNWYSTESTQGAENYTTADAMMQFAQSHRIQVRGHNVFWDYPGRQPDWVKPLSVSDLRDASDKRINSVMSRYRNQLIAWNVVNENMHFDFFESRLADNASTLFYQTANQIDTTATPFLNEFNTIEWAGDPDATPSKYMDKIHLLRSQGYTGPLGIGLESHFTQDNINLANVRSSLEMLRQAESPIWATELDVSPGPNQVDGLEQVLGELYSQEAVNGIMIWGAWRPKGGCYVMCLTDDMFKNLPTGDAVDKFRTQLKQADDDFDAPKTTDSNGFFETTLPHGDYEVIVSHPSQQYSSFRKIKVGPRKSKPQFHLFTITNP